MPTGVAAGTQRRPVHPPGPGEVIRLLQSRAFEQGQPGVRPDRLEGLDQRGDPLLFGLDQQCESGRSVAGSQASNAPRWSSAHRRTSGSAEGQSVTAQAFAPATS